MIMQNYLTISDSASKELSKIDEMIDNLVPQIISFAKTIIIVLLVYFIGKKLIKLVLKLLDKSFERTSMEVSVSGFLLALSKVALNILLIVIIIGILGLPTSSLVALVGSAGLAIGLALQGSLSNFAGGVLILIMKPFKVEDYIIVNGIEGNVTSIDIFYTRLLTVDNKLVVIPNGTLSNSSITNVTNEPTRRLDLNISVAYSTDLSKVKEVLISIAEKNDMVIKDKNINVFIDNYAASSIDLGFRVWVLKENYWILKWNIVEEIKFEFDKNGIEIPFNQLDVNINSK